MCLGKSFIKVGREGQERSATIADGNREMMGFARIWKDFQYVNVLAEKERETEGNLRREKHSLMKER